MLKFECDKCSYKTNLRYNFERHIANPHSRKPPTHQTFSCLLCQTCGFSREQLIRHFVESHNVALKKTNFEFESYESFLAWKNDFERKNASRFVKFKDSATKSHPKKSTYRCHRDGVFKPKGLGKRKTKTLGSNKINSCCPAEIRAELDETGAVNVVLIDTHVGHSKELNRLTLSREERETLAAKIAAKIPFSQIIDEIRENATNEHNRFHLVTRKDLLNIAQAYGLSDSGVSDKRDDATLHSLTDDYIHSGVVRFYKPPGTFLPSHPELELDDFLLVVANDPQIRILQTYGNDCVCFDSTRKLGQNVPQLTTLMVVDDLHQYFPCGFMFSNKIDVPSIKVFLSVIKELAGNFTPGILMSDVSSKFNILDAWPKMPFPTHELLSTWHIDRVWKCNLHKIRGKQKQKEVYGVLRTLLLERDQSIFTRLLQFAVDKFKNDPATSSFGKYFESTFSGNVEKWAHCYRSQIATNTNVFLETMPKLLKHVHCEGKKAGRLDQCIYFLMKFTREKLYEDLILRCESAVVEKAEEMSEWHSKALTTSEVQFIETSEGWSIMSGSTGSPSDIVKNDLTCDCHLRCDECQICLHSFRCSCRDFAVKWATCWHIHSLIINGIVTNHETPHPSTLQEVVVLEEFEVFDPNSVAKEEVIISTSEDNNDGFERAKQDIQELFQDLVASSHSLEHLRELKAALFSIKEKRLTAEST